MIHRGATDCARIGTTGPPFRANITGGPKTCALNCYLVVSFCGTSGSTLYSSRNSVGSQTLLNSCLFTCTNWSMKALGLVAN